MLIAVGAFLLAPAPARAQQHQVTGTITNDSTHAPLAGAQVSVKGTSIGTLSRGDGTYTLTVPSAQDSLVVTYIGYARREVAIAGRSVVDVALAPQVLAMQQLVVVGYGSQRRRDVTGSVSSLDSTSIVATPTPSVSTTLQGRVAGVQVTPASGQPGAQAVIRIRGTGTLNDASPLYVVDGMMVNNIDFLNPQDIASIEVLKDASATAIYGSRGANGVILITTKKGRPGKATRWTASTYQSVQSVMHKIPLVDASQYAMLADEQAANQGVTPPFANPASVGPGTDWQNAVFRSAPERNYELTASGGSDKVTYFFSGDYTDQQGVIPRSGYQRTTLRVNNQYQLSPHIQFGHHIAFSYTKQGQPPNVLSMLYRADPTVPVRDSAGNFADATVHGGSAGNPVAAIHYTDNTGDDTHLVGNLYADVTWMGHFDLHSNFGIDYDRSDYRSFLPVYEVSPTQQNQTSTLTVQTGNTHTWLWENTLTYTRDTRDQRLKLLGGITAQSFFTETLGGGRTNIAGNTQNLWYLSAGDASGATNFDYASNWRMLSYLARANYTYRNRYMLTASLRVDGSSRFGSANRYGSFPSVAVGWDLAQEPFLSDVHAISALKLRASWGETGNDKIGAYPGIPVITGNLNAVFGSPQALQYGADPVALANPLVKWERTTQSDVGLDMAFLQDRIQATVDYYHRLTNGILVQVPIPAYVGVNQEPTVNAASVLNDGFEASVDWTRNIGSVRVDLGANASTVHNEVKSLGQGNDQILAGGLGNEITYTTRTAVGHPIGEFWGYKVIGVFQDSAQVANSPTRGTEAPGDLIFKDINGDGTITSADKTFLGSPIPTLIYGFNVGLRYGRFDVSANFAGQAGNKIFNGKEAVRFGFDNYQTSFLNRWHGPGTSNSQPRITQAGTNYVASSRFIEDGSFLKFQTGEIGYLLPDAVTTPLGVQTARLYLSGTNLFMWTKYSGYTPQVTSGSVIATGIDLGVYPPSRVITVGLNVTM